ncbi:sporulation protein [Brevibacillus fulvus]|uniref:Sporulation protein n=1 Tax=Brevibacillus fulvus TaxID=1125967 RepID=A0A938XYK0_9BACL|nr:sporulation protein [Brevibacillus fulvus]MBM7590201.1 hypothetical protein [Brevibacillus fulvus]
MQRKMLVYNLLLRTVIVGLIAVALAGCGRNDVQQRSMGTRSLDPQANATLINDRNHDELDRQAPAIEDRDHVMGRNQNPNLRIGHSAVINNRVDIENMVMMAKSVNGVENARVTLHGGNAYVTLDLVPNVTAGQARSIEREVIARLRQKVPRYDFHITSNDGFVR